MAHRNSFIYRYIYINEFYIIQIKYKLTTRWYMHMECVTFKYSFIRKEKKPGLSLYSNVIIIIVLLQIRLKQLSYLY